MLFCYDDHSRKMRWLGDGARMRETGSACVILFGRVMCRWEKNIKMDLEGIGIKGPY
jgi:hypothetical protein